MKNLLIAALVCLALPASAGKMKEIWQMTNDSVLETLGFDEEIVAVEGHKFLQLENEDLAVQTTVRGYYRSRGVVPMFQCVTTFVKSENFFDVKKTTCEQLQ